MRNYMKSYIKGWMLTVREGHKDLTASAQVMGHDEDHEPVKYCVTALHLAPYKLKYLEPLSLFLHYHISMYPEEIYTVTTQSKEMSRTCTSEFYMQIKAKKFAYMIKKSKQF
ncbi:hypothetical protein CROQUDRAFT_183722 [Cronartium quercuum f. sp. fusiforme G11]|uniref:Uncharacterized protein n=1 Tax=Cronartium quercuum f. sp. fusiforme G11 TaxID=708437 RepID=A0A9P6TAB6_9BASI|nr:hypothetical protein CROQUDRAFT_183722 [Cronartium quercuum f. sp. fusiforme G11]